ncbi:ZIP zinc transporter [Coniochaeta sp. 2T2.1]|nr:ZIP zinc transporter [Coniochaeta sp. 2T2.1]
MESSGGMDNDTKGWIMCIASGIACVFGASIIYVDYIVRLFPSQRQFRIQDSNIFLACSFSLSFGVMIFSALYSMLPTSMRYLKKGGVDDHAAGFIMMGYYVLGFFGIQVISRVIHQFIPSHVVDCDHSHEEPPKEEGDLDSHGHARVSRSRSRRMSDRRPSLHPSVSAPGIGLETNGDAVESTPLLPAVPEENGYSTTGRPEAPRQLSTRSEMQSSTYSPLKGARSRASTNRTRRPSMMQVRTRLISFVKDTKPNCDQYGPCFGYTDPCGQECFKHLSSRHAFDKPSLSTLRTNTMAFPIQEETGDGRDSPTSLVSPTFRSSRAQSRDAAHHADFPSHHPHSHHDDHEHACDDDCSQMSEDVEAQHHHHVPTNAFLSIGLQTVIAIALHKFPEGFITYATNHASPSLGFNVFMALFVHNIAEGFSMALPLFMALGSRWKAMLWASLLGGFSQPLGAGVAVAWFKIAKRSDIVIDEVSYACLFAVTAGIMTSVALQLFVESLSLNHNRNLSIMFGFLGMSLLGFSNALVSDNH